MRSASAFAVALAGSLLFGTLPQAGAQQTDPPAADTRVTPAPSGYVVGAGDVLQVVVRKEPELTRDQLVRPDGRVTIPLLGEIEAAGKTPEQIADEIARGLARFVNAPRVTVGISQAASARVYIIGQVVRAGEVPLSIPLTVVQALSLAGGFKEFAKKDSIRVVRRDGRVTTFNYKRFEAGLDLARNVALEPGDTVVVP